MSDKQHNDFQCELSIVTATQLKDFIEQSRANRDACEARYANDRRESKEFRDEIIQKIDDLAELLGSIAPSVKTGRKIVWGIAALVAASIISGFFIGMWKFIKIILKFE